MNIRANKMEIAEINGIMRKGSVLTGVKISERERERARGRYGFIGGTWKILWLEEHYKEHDVENS